VKCTRAFACLNSQNSILQYSARPIYFWMSRDVRIGLSRYDIPPRGRARIVREMDEAVLKRIEATLRLSRARIGARNPSLWGKPARARARAYCCTKLSNCRKACARAHVRACVLLTKFRLTLPLFTTLCYFCNHGTRPRSLEIRVRAPLLSGVYGHAKFGMLDH
jgi:hypothetical protein